MLGGVPGNGRAAQALQYAQLNLMRSQRMQLVKALGKAGQRFAGQAKNQVGVQVGVGLIDQPGKISHGFGVVLFARNALLHIDIEALNAHLKLQHARRKLRNHGLEALRQVVRNHLKVDEQVWF